MINDNNKCIIYFENDKTHTITKCGHLCFCGICGFNLDKCSICRSIFNPDTDIIKIFQC